MDILLHDRRSGARVLVPVAIMCLREVPAEWAKDAPPAGMVVRVTSAFAEIDFEARETFDEIVAAMADQERVTPICRVIRVPPIERK